MSVASRCMDAQLHREVDELILDFLIHAATRALLSWTRKEISSRTEASEDDNAEILLQLVSSFITIFRTIHLHLPQDRDVQFKLRLLRFSALFTRRHVLRRKSPDSTTKTLHDGRASLELALLEIQLGGRDKAGAAKEDGRPHVFREAVNGEAGRADRASMATEEAESTRQAPAVSLRDTLRPFMALSAAHIALEDERVTEVWMRLAAGYIAQAVAEQYLVYHVHDPDLTADMFDWGFDEDDTAVEGSDDYLINIMFFDEEAERANATWESIREEHMRALLPTNATDREIQLRALLRDELSVFDFEDRMLGFLEGLHQKQKTPLLSQIQSGHADGLSNAQLEAIQRNIGLRSG